MRADAGHAATAGGRAERTGGPLRRAFQTLEFLADGPRSASDVARLLDVNRSTALRLLSDLEATGYVTRDARTKEFSNVPARFYALLADHDDHVDWSEVIDPILAQLRDEFGEAAVLGVPANGMMVYFAFFASVHVVAVREHLGTTRPMHCSALGKAYLSALDPGALDVELGQLSFQGGTELAAKGPIELRERLEEARRLGYATDLGETFEGAACVAVPVRISGSLVGAIGLSGISVRLTPERMAEIGPRLVDVADEIETR